MVKCPKCGAEIKYIPVSYTADRRGAVAVEPEYTEVINDNGRMIKGHLRHRCPEGGAGPASPCFYKYGTGASSG